MELQVLMLLLCCSVVARSVTEIEKVKLISIHNDLRRQETNAANMREMSWNDELAKMALEASSTCIFRHFLPSLQDTEFSSISQNVYRITGGPLNLTRAVEKWQSEKSRFDYDALTCEGESIVENHNCGHYLQIVQAITTMVGCGYSRCDDGEVYILMCNYSPTSGVDVSPYQAGHPCTNCILKHPPYNNGLCP